MARPAMAATSETLFGDRAGEHLRMCRGHYGAWPHVVIAFLQVAGTLSFLVLIVGALVLEPPGRPPLIADRSQRYQMIGAIGTIGALSASPSRGGSSATVGAASKPSPAVTAPASPPCR